MSRERAPGAALLHPLALVSVLVLVVNDHVLKRACPGVVTGKLSDFAGVLLLPWFLHAAFELLRARVFGKPASPSESDRALAVGAALTMLIFGLPEIWPAAEALYRYGLGALQWPFRATVALLADATVPAIRPVRATADPTDLLALPMALLAYRIGRRTPSRGRSSEVLPVLLAAVLVFAPTPASAAEHTHDGFYFGLELGPALALIDSTASISNGFQQEIPSSAEGVGFPGGGLELGGTLPGIALVLGGRIGFTRTYSPAIETLGERFTLEEHSLGIWNLELIAELYPDPTSGLHFGAGLGMSAINPDIQSTRSSGETQEGWCASLEVGHGLWVGRQWTLGAAARVTAARLEGDAFGTTTLLLPGIYATLASH